MNSRISQISSSLDALTKRHGNVSHNLANASTAGFKKTRSMFALALAEKEAQAGRGGSAQKQIQETSVIDFSEGPMDHTGQPLDLAISGEGFFVLSSKAGPLYTRNGSFQTNAQRQLVDWSGRLVMGTNGPIVLPPNAENSQISVSEEGRISAAGVALGELSIMKFANPNDLRPVGMNAFQAPEQAEKSRAAGARIRQGYREGSNVSVVEELVDLMTVARLYEANLKSIGRQDDSQKQILNVAMG